MATPKRVFTDEYIADLQRRYGRRPDYARPRKHFIAVEPSRQELRDWIEEQVDNLSQFTPLQKINKIVANLRSAKNYVQTRNELAVFSLLRRRGYEPEYERKIDGLTPDWYVPARGDTRDFVVEVLTANPPEEVAKRDMKELELLRSLADTQGDFVVRIWHNRSVELDQRVVKDAPKVCREWLATRPRVGSRCKYGPVTFVLETNNSGDQCGQFYIGGRGGRVTTWPTRRRVTAKVGKYGTAMQSRHLPFVVAFAQNDPLGWAYDARHDALLRQESLRVFFDNRTGEALSAVAWFERRSMSLTHWSVEVIHNPNAAYPLPVGTLGDELPE